MKTILLDFDGTLLKMDVDKFTKSYFVALANYFKADYDPKRLVEAVGKGTYAMIKNDGNLTNAQVFAQVFAQYFKADPNNEQFLKFYQTAFKLTKEACTIDGDARMLIDILKAKGYRLILATNPLFPYEGTKQRMAFVGLSPDDFEMITTYEDCHYCKPNLAYYEEILAKIDEKAENCVMIGNDVDEDMVVQQLGMETILLTDCLINKSQKPLTFDRVCTIKQLIADLQADRLI
ncbi:MAG: HAD family hydrolase [Erysipelotrichaceae bacterium]|nr:HAD family hydrolase [Erysipelotrichaceae bacterium]MDY5252844.1 HAD family hydrolase [Erysipelotrichaceae bacterium]